MSRSLWYWPVRPLAARVARRVKYMGDGILVYFGCPAR